MKEVLPYPKEFNGSQFTDALYAGIDKTNLLHKQLNLNDKNIKKKGLMQMMYYETYILKSVLIKNTLLMDLLELFNASDIPTQEYTQEDIDKSKNK